MGTPHHITLSTSRQTPTPKPRVDASEALSTGHPTVQSLYVHTPFCVHKCHYCDFYSIVDSQDRQRGFLTRLVDELRALAPHAHGAPMRTIFVGGGTPSLLRVELWRELLSEIHRLFDLSLATEQLSGRNNPGDPGFEFTVECNPESATLELLSVLHAGGVNRVSVGAQSFNPRHLKTLERWHNPDNVARAIDFARQAGIPRQSVDLIFGVPGQTLDEWDADLQTALKLKTTHLSCYDLTYEPNTALTARMNAGHIEPIDEDLEAEMFACTASTLASAGLHRYEVSNFARPGDESQHNLVYWRQGQWLAAGPSASGHVYASNAPDLGGYRWKNAPRLGDYLDSTGFSPIIDLETPDPARALRERVMMGLRLAEGIDAGATAASAAGLGPDVAERARQVIDRLADRGDLERRTTTAGGRLVIPQDRVIMTDGIAAELMAALSPSP